MRLHVEFDLAKGGAARAGLTTAKFCEQAWWRQHPRPGTLYVGDRNYGAHYALLGDLMAKGVAMQCYLALIAGQLLVLHSGHRPNKRQMELIQFYLLGWARAV